MPLSTYAANNILDHVTGVQAWTAPTNTYFSLHTADPGLTGANEIGAGWYARQLASWNSATTAGATNNGQHTFPTVTGAGVTVTHIGLWDALTVENFLFSIDIADTAFTVGSAPKILDAAVTITPGSAYHHDIIPDITDHLTGQGSMTFVNQCHLALFTSNPTQSTNGTEASGGSYARQNANFDTTVGGNTENFGAIVFPTATANIGTVTGFAIMNGLSGTNFHLIGALSANQTINNGDDYEAADGDIDLTT